MSILQNPKHHPQEHTMQRPLIPTEENCPNPNPQKTNIIPNWYTPKSGIYSSKFPPRTLPSDPFLDIVSFIFSHTHSGNTALIDSSSGHSISYPELLPLIKSIASGLHQMGVRQGDVILILLPNSVYFPVILLGILYLGAVVTTMNPLSSLAEIKKQTQGCNAKVAFTWNDKIDQLTSLGIVPIAVPDHDDMIINPEKTKRLLFHKMLSVDPDSVIIIPSRKIRQNDTAVILYSSGTTGACKGVVLTHGNFIAMIELFVRFESSLYHEDPKTTHDDVYLAVLPMFHVYGLSLFVMGLLSLGNKIVVMKKFVADELVRVIDKYGVTHFPAVPPLIKVLADKAKDGGSCGMKSLKQVSSGAAPLNTKSIEDFVHALPHVDFIQGYGMSETTALGTRGFNTKEIQNYTSVGYLAPNMEARVVDSITGLFMPPGRMGELWLRGPGVMKGYLNNVEATLSTVDENGWLRTGDIVYFDQDGNLHVVDRLKEIIKYKGFQIAPADLEDVLVSHPDILDAAVTGARDEDAGEVPLAFVVKRPGIDMSEAAVISYVAKQVAPYKKVRKVVFTPSIPRSAAGKILRRELRTNFSSKL